MNTPVTALDQRYSGANAQAVSWEDTKRLLEAAQISWISTVRADGRPHVTPLVAVWTDGTLYFTTGVGEQKFVNLRANPYVVLTTGTNDWDHGIDVVVEGKAELVTDEAVLTRVAKAYSAKWDGAWQFEVRDGRFYNHGADEWPSEVFGVAPTRAFAHSKGEPFGATTHRF
jgi:nitroimidazol reductase NimA-like FMN-containing flavoprotein (pyridoxamine 5'-phosphate oxidase superfamily)